MSDDRPWHTIGSDTQVQFTDVPQLLRTLNTKMVLFTDSADTFICGGEEEILKKYEDAGYDVLYAAEEDVYPRALHDDYVKAYPDIPGPWRAPNCGGWI